VAVFLASTFAISAFFEFLIIRKHTINTFLVLPLMWTPGLVAIACSNGFKNQLRDLSLNRSSRRMVGLAYLVPATAALLTFIICVATDIGRINFSQDSAIKALIVQPTIGVFLGTLLAMGEELGWRGFLHTHVARARWPHPVLITSGIWAVWHWPLILGAGYSSSELPWLSLILFTIQVVSFGVFLGWIRERSRSVVPAALAHGVHNTWIQSLTPVFYQPGRLSPYFMGESGFVIAILYLILAIYIYRRGPIIRF
jgi:membrane protease YdiL (CAAX protease family)